VGCNVENYNYEDILELLHSEKYSSDLQSLKKEYLAKVQQYLDAKKALFDNTTNKDMHFKLQMEIENAERAIRDLYSKREQKILKDTTNMLPKEEIIYNQLIELLISSQKSFYSTIQNAAEPKLLKAPHRTLKFREAVPELLDLRENKHGPFQANDTAELPEELAKILVAQNKADVVEK